jgi:hypothetical protein
LVGGRFGKGGSEKGIKIQNFLPQHFPNFRIRKMDIDCQRRKLQAVFSVGRRQKTEHLRMRVA